MRPLTPVIKQKRKPFVISIDFWGQEYAAFECFTIKKAVKILDGLTEITRGYKTRKPKKKAYYRFK